MYIGYCEYCNKIIEDDRPTPERKPIKSIEELAEYFQPTPHYICAECLRKELSKSKESEG